MPPFNQMGLDGGGPRYGRGRPTRAPRYSTTALLGHWTPGHLVAADLHQWLWASAAERSVAMAIVGSAAPNTLDPATKVSAPASAAMTIVCSVTPPSTCSQMSRPLRCTTSRSATSFGIMSGMNDWP